MDCQRRRSVDEVCPLMRFKNLRPRLLLQARGTSVDRMDRRSESAVKRLMSAEFLFLCCCILLSSSLIRQSNADSINSRTSRGAPTSTPSSNTTQPTTNASNATEAPREPFRLGPVIKNWDQQREDWLQKYPHKRLTPQGRPHMILVTSSPPNACPAAKGDYTLLRSLKNKADYCRLHMVDLYYNMAVMEMDDFWIKLPIVRKLMLSHPEAEWIWWMDSDALFTDMTFQFPVEKYDGFNLVVHGWDKLVYEEKKWVGLNAGIFLLRNNQWSLDFLDMWAPMGENVGNSKIEMGHFLSKQLTGRPDFEADDQAAMVYLLISRPELRPKVFLESSYHLHGYWVELAARFEEMLKKYRPGDGGEKWPFITHFVGCKFCAGKYNSTNMENCATQMERAYNIADDQILGSFGYKHESLNDVGVKPIAPKE